MTKKITDLEGRFDAANSVPPWRPGGYAATPKLPCNCEPCTQAHLIVRLTDKVAELTREIERLKENLYGTTR